jgi:hypothetical protein
MSVTPLPRRGGVQSDRRDANRAIRVAAHPEQGLVTLSLWRGDSCVASHQMAASDAASLIALLADALTALSEPADRGSAAAS